MMKRIIDIIIAAVGLALIGPLFALIALGIRLEGPPVFYRGLRVGLHGKQFRIYKFRSMVVNAEQIGPSSTSDEDTRITALGSFLRKYKLDELPQLLNVLSGEMSLVGPRPEVKHFTDMYSGEEKLILSVRPGITDWASIWNSDEGSVLAGAEDPDRAYMELIRPTKIKLQLKYVREQSFTTDIKIICFTILALLRPQSAALMEIKQQDHIVETTP